MLSTETSQPAGRSPRRRRGLAAGLPASAVLAAALLLSVVAPKAFALESRVLAVDYRNARELLPAAAGLLSAQGRISADDRTNALVVVDTPAAIERVAALIRRLDRASVPLRIEVRFEKTQQSTQQGAGVEGSASGDGWRLEAGTDPPDDGVRIRVRGRSRTGAESNQMAVTTMAGSPAYLTVGTEVPYRQQRDAVCRRYGNCPSGVEFQRVQTGFFVPPRLAGERVAIEIVPEIADIASGRRVCFAAAADFIRRFL